MASTDHHTHPAHPHDEPHPIDPTPVTNAALSSDERADMLAGFTTALEQHAKPIHTCNLSWCAENGTTETDHAEMGAYTPARLSPTTETVGTGATVPTVGVAAGTTDGTPSVLIEIDGADTRPHATLTISDARRLRDHLEQAIANAEQVTRSTTTPHNP